MFFRRTNLIAQAQSGTGKTAAFTLGMLSSYNPAIKAPQVYSPSYPSSLPVLSSPSAILYLLLSSSSLSFLLFIICQVLCLCPTRELAKQNYNVLSKIGQHLQYSATLAISEADRKYSSLPHSFFFSSPFISSSHSSPYQVPRRITDPIVIGTPGKVLDLMNKGALPTKDINLFVLDEADFMVDEGSSNIGEQSKRIKR